MQKPASRVEPEGMRVVFHRPMNRIAGQSVLTRQGGNPAVFQPAHPAFSGGPECAFLIESKVADATLAQPLRGSVRRADLPVSEIGDATQKKSDPHPALRRISG